MKRKIIKIDKEMYNGCSLCTEACHEGGRNLKNINPKIFINTQLT